LNWEVELLENYLNIKIKTSTKCQMLWIVEEQLLFQNQFWADYLQIVVGC